MQGKFHIKPIVPHGQHLEHLSDEARQDGYFFMDRLAAEVRSGENGFQKPGECFLGAIADGMLIGCGGLNRDPYVTGVVGRLRHLYVLRAYRKKGIGAALVQQLLEHSKSSFEVVRLRTSDASAGLFYDALGFERVAHESATHRLFTKLRH